MPGERPHVIEAGAHIERASALRFDQRQIDGGAHAVRRAAARISDIRGVGQMTPENPLRFRRAERVEHSEPEAEALRQVGRARQQQGRIGVQMAGGSAIDRAPGEVQGRRVQQVDLQSIGFRGISTSILRSPATPERVAAEDDGRVCRAASLRLMLAAVPAMLWFDMKILAMDTSAGACSAALWTDAAVVERVK